MEFSKLQSEHAEQIAELHIQGISTGFISSLGIGFVTALYKAIAQSKSSFGFTATENGQIAGFVAFTTDINELYKSVIFKSGLKFAFLLAGKMLSFQKIKKIVETLLYPDRIKKLDLPKAELLSIVVDKNEQGKGLASELVKAGLAECAKKNIDKVKVLVADENIAANKLYQKCGFDLAGQMENHGVVSNVYIAEVRSENKK